MASEKNPDELQRENKDLRKKIAYLEDKVAYLTELYNKYNYFYDLFDKLSDMGYIVVVTLLGAYQDMKIFLENFIENSAFGTKRAYTHTQSHPLR